MRHISDSNLGVWLTALRRQYDVYAPVAKGNTRVYASWEDSLSNIVIGEVRAFEPMKAFLFRARQRVADGFSSEVPERGTKPICLVGVKACDLKGLAVLDYVFKDCDDPDPWYARAREQTLIIAADCTTALDTCFCLALGVKPFPETNFDVLLAAVKSGFVVDIGSEKGKAAVANNASLFSEATPDHLAQRDEQRQCVVRKVEANLAAHSIPMEEAYAGIVEAGYESTVWSQEADTCVECGACNTICPTCHCFLLYDQKSTAHMSRFRIWDSCMIKDFARVAGGANPRPKLWMRLRNRFEKKFDFFPKVAKVYACTGCGRCISACPGKIDIRRVLKRLVAHA